MKLKCKFCGKVIHEGHCIEFYMGNIKQKRADTLFVKICENCFDTIISVIDDIKEGVEL